jgi:hypothetical protein
MTSTPNKEQVMLELLKDAWVYVQLDPRREGVDLPDFLRHEPRLVLQYGYNMPVPIHDLSIDAQGIKATLSFRRVPHATVVPWSAVFAITDGDHRGFVWEADLPADLNIEMEIEKEAAAPARPEPVKPQPSQPAAGRSAGPAGKKPRPSHLKLVD